MNRKEQMPEVEINDIWGERWANQGAKQRLSTLDITVTMGKKRYDDLKDEFKSQTISGIFSYSQSAVR